MVLVFVQTDEEKMKLLSLIVIAISTTFCTSQKPIVSKKGFLGHAKNHKSYGKSAGYFQAHLKEITNTSDVLTVQATVTPQRLIDQTVVEWQFPEHLTMVDGDSKSTADFSDNSKKIFEVSFNKDQLKPGDQIFLFVYKMIDGEKHGISESFVYQNKVDQLNKATLKAKKPVKYYE